MAIAGPDLFKDPRDEESAGVDLMRRIQAGEHAALDEALGRYWAPLVRYARGFVRSHDAAEDAAQESFVQLWRHRENWRTAGSLRACLYRILRNHLLNERRALRVRDRWRDRVLRSDRRGPATPVELAEYGELSGAVAAALASLSPQRRRVFTLSRVHGFSYREISEALDLAPQTVANHMSAALSALREELAPFRPSTSEPSASIPEDTA